jgi:hypothetical protein
MEQPTPRHRRQTELLHKLRQELGPAIGAALTDDDVIEIIVNPNGELWLDRLSLGMERTGMRLPESQIEMAIGTVAHFHELVVHRDAPRLLPGGGVPGIPQFSRSEAREAFGKVREDFGRHFSAPALWAQDARHGDARRPR